MQYRRVPGADAGPGTVSSSRARGHEVCERLVVLVVLPKRRSRRLAAKRRTHRALALAAIIASPLSLVIVAIIEKL